MRTRIFSLLPLLLTATPALSDPPAPLVTLDQVEAITQSKPIVTLEDLVQGLPDALRSRFTFVHTSRSRQGASFEYPRAIIYGPDAQFILAFNGHPSEVNYNSIEMIQFDSAASQFRFATVELPENGAGRAIFNRDATRCTGCHGASVDHLHPVWDGYFLWRGLYGGIDDDITKGFSGTYLTDEETAYRTFLKNVKSDPTYSRYTVLPFNPSLDTPPYGNVDAYDFHQRPNFGLTVALDRLNARRVAAELVTAPGWKDPSIRKTIATLLVNRDETRLTSGFEAQASSEAATLYASINSSFRLDYPEGSSYVGDQVFIMQSAGLLGIVPDSMLLGRNDEFVHVYEGSAADFHSYVLARVLELLGGTPRTEDKLAGYPDAADFSGLGGSLVQPKATETAAELKLISGS
jgi:hypothetical protein